MREDGGGREDQKFKVILRYIGSLTPAWAKGHVLGKMKQNLDASSWQYALPLLRGRGQ